MNNIAEGRSCTQCSEWKSAEFFSKAKDNTSGLHPWCKSCQRSRDQERYQARKAIAPIVQTRACGQCGETKPADQFYRNATNDTGLQPYCKPCLNQRSKERVEANPEALRQYAHDWYESKREQLRADHRAYYANHAEVATAIFHKRRKRLQHDGRNFTPSEWLAVRQQADGRCLACGETAKLTVDHVVPLSRGGSNGIENVQALCWSCNRSKGTKTIDYRIGATPS